MKRTAVLTVSFILLFLPNLHAGEMSELSRLSNMPPLSITGFGDVGAQYENFYTKNSGGSSSKNLFGSFLDLHLNVKGFIVDRRFMRYGVSLDYGLSGGDSSGIYSLMSYRGVSLYMLFFPYGPLNFDLRGQYLHSTGQDSKSAGLSVTYTRTVLSEAKLEALKEMEQLRQKAQQQHNEDEDEEENGQQRQNIINRSSQIRPKIPERGLLYYLLPKLYKLELDVTDTKPFTTFDARLFLSGDYGKTQYLLSASDYLTKDGRSDATKSSTNNFYSSLSTITRWTRGDILNNNAYFTTDDTRAYGISSALSGPLRRLDYALSASYAVTENNERTTTYQTGGSLGNSSVWGKTLFLSSIGLFYQRFEGSATGTSDNTTGTVSLGTSTALTPKMSIDTGSNLTGDSDNNWTFSFRIGDYYRITNRLTFTTSYSFADSTHHQEVTLFPGQPNMRPTPRHTIEAGLAYNDRITVISNAGLILTPSTESERWYTSVSTYIWKMNLALLGDITRNKPRTIADGVSKDLNYSFYAVAGMPLFLNSSLQLRAFYGKSDVTNILTGIKTSTTSWNLDALLYWQLRQFIIEGEVYYGTSDTAMRTQERRIFLRVMRRFRFI